MGLIETFRKGRDAAHAERGYTPRRRLGSPAADAASTAAPEGVKGGESDDPKKLLADVVELAEQLQKRVAELETERDALKQQSDEAVAATEPARQRIAALEAEHDDKKKLIKDLTAQVETLQQRAGAMESDRALFADVLQIPGVRKVLLKIVHPDTHTDADAEQRAELTAWNQQVNAAYALLAKNKS